MIFKKSWWVPPSPIWMNILVALVMMVLPHGPVAAQYEEPANRNVREILPAELITGDHYRIDEAVFLDGFMHTYAVQSDFGVFQVTGDIALRKLLREIEAIAALKEIETSDAVGDSLKYTAKAPLRFAKDLVTEPADTVLGLGRGIGRIFGNVSKAVSAEKDPSEDSRMKQILQVSAWKRNYSAEFDIDVYSSNAVLQDELDRVGWASALAGLSLSAVTAPISNPVVTGAKASRMADQVGGVLTEEPPSRLRIINEAKMRSMGASEELIEVFLDHPAFTPRHDTIIAESLSQLEQVQGRAGFFTAALEATDEESANFYQHMAEILLGYHQDVSPLVEIANHSGLIIARAASGSVLIPVPVDFGIWIQPVEGAVDSLLGLPPQPAAGRGHEVWMTGTASDVLREQLQRRNIQLVEDVDTLLGFFD